MRFLLAIACLLYLENGVLAQDTVLYAHERSSSSWRVRAALELKGIPYAYREVDRKLLASDEYRALNPQGKIPTLLIDGLVLTQSLAIIEYLEETRPVPSLLPDGPEDRARARAIALMVAADIQPLQNLAVLDHLPEHMRKQWAQLWIRKGFSALETVLAESSGRYCVGDRISVADLLLAPQLRNAHLFDVDLGNYPTLQKLESTLKEDATFGRMLVSEPQSQKST